jgi:hypothetical protein
MRVLSQQLLLTAAVPGTVIFMLGNVAKKETGSLAPNVCFWARHPNEPIKVGSKLCRALAQKSKSWDTRCSGEKSLSMCFQLRHARLVAVYTMLYLTRLQGVCQ